MSAHNKVLWSEGLFLQPHHFQQQDRYFERYVESRAEALVPHAWGFSEIEIDTDLLALGKFGIRRAAGVFPDGTPLRLPDDDPLPHPIDVSPTMRNEVVYLAVPVRLAGVPDVDRAGGNGDVLSRHALREWEARDLSSPSGEPATLEVGSLRTRLLLGSERTDAYACIPLALIAERRTDAKVVLDDAFIPTVMRVSAAPRLAAFTARLAGRLHQQGEALASRAVATARGAAAQIEDYLTLQVINRYDPVVAHFKESGAHHPEALYRLCLEMAGELATFATKSKRPPVLPPYEHHRLRESFEPLMAAIEAELSVFREPNAVRIPIEPREFGISIASVADPTLFSTAVFVLAAKADVPAEDLRRRFPNQLKVGPPEKIGNLVMLALAGVPVNAMPVAPRQIPFNAGYAYFELDQSDALWQELTTSGGVALHVGGEFPGLAMEFWAIRA
jgi:type VI secretion system protein ImpJ